MAERTLNTIIVLRNDSSTDWAKSSVVLKAGELGISYVYEDDGVIIKNVIVKAGDGKHTWADLPQVESVLESNMLLTHAFGKHKPAAGSFVDAGGAGMTMSQWVADALKETVEPTIKNYPQVVLEGTVKTLDVGDKEIGSYITAVSYTASLSEDGDYETNGKVTASGIKASDVAWEVTLGNDATTKKTSTTGEYATNVQINSTTSATYAIINAKATLSLANVITPVNNLGQPNAAKKINGFDAAGTIVKNLTANVTATGYRDTWYYIGTDCTTPIDSAFIRNSTSVGSNTTTFSRKTIPGGTKRVMFAVLGDKTLKSVVDVDGMGLDVKGNFTKRIIAVEGANGFEAANYSVFVAENPAGMAATRYDVTIN